MRSRAIAALPVRDRDPGPVAYEAEAESTALRSALMALLTSALTAIRAAAPGN